MTSLSAAYGVSFVPHVEHVRPQVRKSRTQYSFTPSVYECVPYIYILYLSGILVVLYLIYLIS